MARLSILKPRLGLANTHRLKLPPKTADDHYRTREHKAWRMDVLRRAGFTCEQCGKRGVKFYADHIVEIKDGGSKTDPRNGRCLCAPCHGIKTAKARGQRVLG